jgi:hypothetical protein
MTYCARAVASSKWGLLGLVLIALPLQAQRFAMDLFHPGRVYLYESDTLEGMVKYDFSAEQVQVQIGDRLLSYNTAKLNKVEISDEASKALREFVVFEYSLNQNGYELPVLFEFLLDGKIQVLSREAIIWETVSNFMSPYSMPVTMSQRRLVTTLYFRSLASGKIKRYTFHKSDLMNYLRSKSGQLKQYMKTNKLKATRKEDVLLIIDYFNQLR